MAKQLNVNLQFTADASQAKKQVQELQHSLQSLLGKTKIDLGIEQEINDAIRSTAELSMHLKEATNISTGNLDFSRLSQSIKASGKTLQSYGDQLKSLGPQGQQAFMQLVQAVSQAEIPIRRVNSVMQEFATTLANTARWQLSSTILHGFMGALQTAYGYAQDLNESLNNIRIVTGRSVEDMQKFAKEANKAAKSLSTSTTSYTKASLIYYQQGLSDADVKKRADVTIKLANVSRQNAEEVSDQMTAIWNNFYDGSKSLEYYADVLTALGQATASSSEEIAGGLEKFAAVAETIGLSYEYAAAALATLTSNTRESEEVVGTALKTIFARIQGLSLGETLDDGTTLNKYSQALRTAGINIQNASGELKNMDTILDELGAKWDNLSRAQQAALAQTIAGTRQYNQLMALMANWNNGDNDSFQANLATASGANGTLDEQASIYAEGWEGASKRVQAAAETIYDKLLNDEFFIDLLNNFEKILGAVDKFIDGLGGLKGVLLTVGAVATRVLSGQISKGLTNMAYNIKMILPGGHEKVQKERDDFIKQASMELAKDASGNKTRETTSAFYQKQLRCQQQLIEGKERMNEAELKTVQLLMDQLKLSGELAIKKAQEKDESQNEEDKLYSQLYGVARAAKKGKNKNIKFNDAGVKEYLNDLKVSATASAKIEVILKRISNKANITTEDLEEMKSVILEGGDPLKKLMAEDTSEIMQLIDNIQTGAEGSTDALRGFMSSLEMVARDAAGGELGKATLKDMEKYQQAVKQTTIYTDELSQSTKHLDEKAEGVTKTIDKAAKVQATWADKIVATASAILSLSEIFNIISTLVETLQNPDTSGWEKFTEVLSMIPGILTAVIAAMGALKVLFADDTKETIFNTIAKKLNSKAKKDNAAASNQEAAATENSTEATKKDTASNFLNKLFKRKNNAPSGGSSGGQTQFPTFGKNGHRTFSGQYDSKGRPLAKNSANGKLEIIGTKNYKAAGLDPNGKPLPNTGGGAGAGAGGGAGAAVKGFLSSPAAAIAVAAIIVAVCAQIIWAIDQVLRKDEIAASKAKKASQELAKSYEEVKGKYAELQNTISSYKNAKDGIKELTRGTAEFTEQITAANDEALKLIKTYGGMEGFSYTVDENGMINIDDETMQQIQKQEQQKVVTAQSASIIADQYARDASITANTTDIARNKIKSVEGLTAEDNQRTGQVAAGVGAAGAVAGTAIGMAIGSAVPVVGTLIGAAAGAIIGGIAGHIYNVVQENSATDAERKALDEITKAYEEKGEEALSDQYLDSLKGKYNDDLIEELKANKDAVRQLCEETKANTAATRAENIAMANGILANNETVQQSQHADYIATFAGDTYGKKSEEIYKNIIESNEYKGAWFGLGTEKQKNLWNEYAKSAGLNDLSDMNVKYYKGDGSVVYTYIDEEGKTQEKTVTLEQMAAQSAADQAKNATNTAGEEIAKALENVSTDTVKLVAGAKNKDMSGVAIGQLIGKSNYSGITSDEWTTLGITQSQVEEQKKKQLQDIKDYANSYGGAAQKIINTIVNPQNSNIQKGFENIAQGTIKEYAKTIDALETMFAGSKQDNLQGAADSFNAVMTDLIANNTAQADNIMSIANGIDWSQGEAAMREFNYQMLQIGINIDENSDQWKNFANSMANANVSVLNQDINTLRQNLATIQQLTQDIELGSIISDEDYDKLIKYNAELERYFIMTADGYKYVGGKDTFTDTALQDFEKAIQDNDKARRASTQFANIGDISSYASGLKSDSELAALVSTFTGDGYKEHLSTLGVTPEKLQQWQTALTTGTAEQKKVARDFLKQFYGDVMTLQNKVAVGDYDDGIAEEIYLSSTVKSLAELEAKATEGGISKDSDAYKKWKDYLTNELTRIRKEEYLRQDENNLAAIDHDIAVLDSKSELTPDIKRSQNIDDKTSALQSKLQNYNNQQKKMVDALGEEQTELKNKYKDILFNEDGTIANYNDLMESHTADWDEISEALNNYENNLNNANEMELNIYEVQNEIVTTSLEHYNVASEALQKYTTKLEKHTQTLDHYKDLLSLIGDEKNYEAIGTIIAGQIEVLDDSLIASTKSFKMYDDEAIKWQSAMNELLDASGNIIVSKESEYAAYEKLWKNASEKADEYQNKMLSDLQAWAEAEKELLENTLADLGKTLEESLTGGTSFDELNTSMKRAQSLQEEYLTTTNQIYETTKMMRTAQQAIDTTTNTIAKNKLKNFITETKTLQEQGTLSKFELETQQAKYDLLVAEIALEEAQNAKNTVRLQRDSEGNFGYVYTADSAAVNEAQQQFDDAQNALYNKGLEGANNYSQKYTTTMQEMYDTLKTVNENYMNGVYESEEEYQAAMTATKQYYYDQLAQYSSLYSIALSTDSRIVAESWTTDFQNMTKDASNWQTKVDDYLGGAEKAFNRWSGVIATVKETTGSDLSALSNGVKAITDESAKLVESLTAEDTGLIPTLISGFTEVKNAILQAFGIMPDNITITANGNKPEGAATGGLTSSWGPEGKMLMVHENELILNSEQTNRFFDNLAFMESILATIDSYAMNQQLSGVLSSPNYIERHGDTLEQNVHIEASFPGVTDRSEIEEAFNNLVNKASQYANRK